MTAEELQAQIKLLEEQLKSLRYELEEPQNYRKGSKNITRVKNYEYFFSKAEDSFLKKEYLEAFLIQSCIIDGVLKEYASKKLLSIISQSVALENKFKSFEFARIIDELFISGKIKKDLYENLSAYRKKRNSVVHGLLKYKGKEKLDEELKKAYKSGKHMKVFIVDDMNEEIKGGLTVIELEAQIAAFLSQLDQLQLQLVELSGNNK